MKKECAENIMKLLLQDAQFNSNMVCKILAVREADCPRVVVRTQAPCAHAHQSPVSMLTELWRAQCVDESTVSMLTELW